MPTWNLHYKSTFDPVGPLSDDPVYTIEIHDKDYGGDPVDIICAAVPVLHQWQTDDPVAPIKGSSVQMSFINQNGSLPLSTFFSTDDDQFKVRLYWTTNLMFEGFIVQDDCTEEMVDFTHQINLSANDNLGLLKDVPFNEGKIEYDSIITVNDSWSVTAPHTLTLPAAVAALTKPGDIIHIDTGIISNIRYHVMEANGDVDVLIAELVVTGSSGPDDIELLHPQGFDDKITLAFVLETCLFATGLELDTKVFCNFKEINQDLTKNFITEILIDPQTFLKDDFSFDDCYAVLEKTLKRFNLTLFQARGTWNIVHWFELFIYGYPIPGFQYDVDFSLVSDEITLNSETVLFPSGFDMFQIQPREDTQAESAPLHKVLRPVRYNKETFNYQQPRRLLRNWDLQELGALVGTSTTGSGTTLQTIREYEATWWSYTDAFPTQSGVNGAAVFYIRIIYDYLDNEIERYLVTENNDIHSYPIEANTGDVFTFSFTFKTPGENWDGASFILYAQLTDGINTRYACELNDPSQIEPGWQNGVGFNVTISGDTDLNFTTVTMTSQPVPFDGLLTFYLRDFRTTPSDETLYTDIRLEYSFFINNSTKIIGQTHKTEQFGTIKLNEEEEIFTDTTPRNSIAGTLFSNSMTGLLQDRASRWFLANGTDVRQIGDLTTNEFLFWRRIRRSIVEGSFIGLTQYQGDHVSLLSAFNISSLTGLNFVGGMMEIDYRNNRFSGTLWEMCNDTEVAGDLSATYEFKFLYATK